MITNVFVSPHDSHDGVVMPMQAHTNTVLPVLGSAEIQEPCDALITGDKKITLGVHTRDCAPVCVSDGKKIAVAHVGWPGLCSGLLTNVLACFDHGAIEVFVGPHLHTFEIQRDFCYDAVTERFGHTFLEEHDGLLVFRFKDAIASELPQTTLFDERSTALDTTLPSHRHKRNFGHIITTASLPYATH